MKKAHRTPADYTTVVTAHGEHPHAALYDSSYSVCGSLFTVRIAEGFNPNASDSCKLCVRMYNGEVNADTVGKPLLEEWQAAWAMVKRYQDEAAQKQAEAERAKPPFRRFRLKTGRFGAKEGPRSYAYVEYNGRELRAIGDDGKPYLGPVHVYHTPEEVARYVSEGVWVEVPV